jgi:hypothetical protein
MAYGSAIVDQYSWNHPKWEDAIKREDREKWLEADRVEQARLMEHNCIPFLDEFAKDGGYSKIPKGCKAIHCMRICWIKPNGIYKVRIIYFGHLEGFVGDTFSPTGTSQAFWLMTHLGLILSANVTSFDLENAFCHELCPRDLYVVLDGKVRKPINQFYGGKDGPITFNKGFVEHNELGGYMQSKNDPCVFVKHTSDSNWTWIYAHVDDFKCWETSAELLDEYEQHLSKKYSKVKKTEDGDYLGIPEERVSDGSIFTKPKSLLKLFELWPVDEKSLSSGTPVPMLKEYIKNIDNDSPLVNSTEYRSCLGLLQQQLPVRPDISFPISKLATRSNSANERDMEALRHLIKYLWITRNRGFILRGNDLVDREFRVKLLA